MGRALSVLIVGHRICPREFQRVLLHKGQLAQCLYTAIHRLRPPLACLGDGYREVVTSI